jgi:Fe-S-cluster-containing dehydrogenase component
MQSEPTTARTRKHALLVDASLCIGCGTCSAACKQEHDFPAGPRTVKIIRLGPVEEEGKCVMACRAVTCYHCDRPACVLACPTGAMQKRADGIVFSSRDLCIGCRTCAVACPFGIPELNPAEGKIAKCDGCMDRVDAGLWPACALVCPTGALSFGSPGRVVQDRRTREALRIVRSFPAR